MKESNDFLRYRVEALEKELKRLQDYFKESSEVATEKAKGIEVILNDPNFNKKLTEINIDYGK